MDLKTNNLRKVQAECSEHYIEDFFMKTTQNGFINVSLKKIQTKLS